MTFPARLHVFLGEASFIFLSNLWSQGGAVKTFLLSLQNGRRRKWLVTVLVKSHTTWPRDAVEVKTSSDLNIERQTQNGTVNI